MSSRQKHADKAVRAPLGAILRLGAFALSPMLESTKLVRIPSLKTVEEFRKHVASLGVELPCEDSIATGGASPLTQPIEGVTINGKRIGNRWAVQPMEGWDGTTTGGATEEVRRRWQRFGESGAKLIPLPLARGSNTSTAMIFRKRCGAQFVNSMFRLPELRRFFGVFEFWFAASIATVLDEGAGAIEFLCVAEEAGAVRWMWAGPQPYGARVGSLPGFVEVRPRHGLSWIRLDLITVRGQSPGLVASSIQTLSPPRNKRAKE
jgi:hypothetical protein